MKLLVVDIGGSAVKYGIWENEQLKRKNQFSLPETWEQLLAELHAICAKETEIEGITFSVPGLVDAKSGEIKGITAVPYIHQRNFREELENEFSLKIAMENDANCAALSELWTDEQSDIQNFLYFVFGTGVGGAVIMNRQLVRGPSFFGGEFGYMLLNDSSTFSEVGTVVGAAKHYSERAGHTVSGKELFELANQGDYLAKYLLDEVYRYGARGIFNLLVSLNPEKVVIAGGVSANPQFIQGLKQALEVLVHKQGATAIEYELEPSKFGNDANLYGAVYNYIYN